MAEPSILKGSDHFFTNLYEGNGGGQRVGKFVPFTDNGTIAKSCIFENGGPAYLNKTYGGAGTSLKKFTFSCWFKIGGDTIAGTAGYFPTLFNVGGESGKYFSMFIQSQYQNIQLYSYNSTYDLRKITNRTFEDPTKWYHIVCAIDTTESTGSDRVKLYIDGDRITSFSTSVDPSQDYDLSVGAAEPYYVGFMNSGDTWDGYMAEVNYVDGTALTPSTFGLTDTSTGRWIPKTLTGITYGTNGFRMQFANSAGQTIGDDTSGNGNDFTVNNIATTDIVTDSPTQNHSGFNPVADETTSSTLSEGNLTTTISSYGSTITNIALPTSGKYYWEFKATYTMDGNTILGVQPQNGIGFASSGQFPGGSNNPNSFGIAPAQGSSSKVQAVKGSTFTDLSLNKITTSGTFLQFCWDGDTGSLWFGYNNSFEGDPGAGTGAVFTGINDALKILPAVFAQNGSYEVNFGQRGFEYTPPSGFVALQQDNLPETSKGMSDFVWIKNRDATDDHQLYDNSRGPQNMLEANQSSAEETDTDGLQKFLKGGCQIEDDVRINTSGESYVSWNWVANGGTTTANTDGSGATLASTIQANQTAGFSVVTYTGNASAGAKVAHGLSQAPDWFIIKSRSVATNWYVYHKDLGASSGLYLNTNAAAGSGSANAWNQTNPTSSVITLNGTGYGSNNNSATYLMYCWHEVPGYSKFGIYTGGGGTDGTFTYTGFKPAWLLVKRHNSSGNWYLIDTARGKFNDSDGSGKTLMPNHTNAEAVQTRIDLLSNGFKQRINNDGSNLNSAPYVYFAFAEHPFAGTSSINPATAR